MDAQHLDIDACVGLALAARDTGAARQIGIDRDELPETQRRARAERRDLPGKFMAHDARIIEERMPARKDMIIGAAQADPANADQDLAWPCHRGVPVDQTEPKGFMTYNRAHGGRPPLTEVA
jgi:hypothetical protein